MEYYNESDGDEEEGEERDGQCVCVCVYHLVCDKYVIKS